MKTYRGFLVMLLFAPFVTGCSAQMGFVQSATGTSDLAATTPAITPIATPATGSTTGSILPTTPVVTCPAGQTKTVARETKILFLVDTSGSNALAADSTGTVACNSDSTSCLAPTDPNKAFRAGAISKFFNEYQSHTNIQWGFATFSGTSAQALITNSSGQPSFSSDPSQMQNALSLFEASTDTGATPYSSALSLAHQMIAADSDLKSTANPEYYVILITDGFPTDYVSSSGAFQLTSLESDIQSLVSLAPTQVTLSTVYYGAASVPGAISLLQQMATTGLGHFANENGANSSFSIDDLITIPIVCQ